MEIHGRGGEHVLVAPRRILIVDDSAAFCSQLSKALRTLPEVETHSASDGIEALKLFQDYQFALIITDLNMPVMGGLRFITKVRSIRGYHDIPILVISGSASMEERGVALDIGAGGYLAKPVKLSAVISAASALLDGRPAGPPAASRPPEAAPPAPGAPPRRRRVLVCDDDVVLLRLLTGYLTQQMGMEVRVARNGEEVLAVLRSWNPDLIILDYMMPKLSGGQVLKAIRGGGGPKPPGADAKIVVYSAINVKKDVLNSGADGFLQKPATVDQIRDMVLQYTGG